MVSTEIDTLLLVVPCFLLTCSIILNMTGVYLLRSLKSDLTNNKTLLLNLSFVEIFSSVSMMVYWFDGYFQFCNFRTFTSQDSLSVACTLHLVIDWYLYLLCLLSPITFLPDRFLAVTFPLKYRRIFPKRKVKFVIIGQWIIATIPVTLLLFVSHKHWLRCLQYSAVTIELIVFGSALVTYSWIVCKIRQLGRIDPDSHVRKVACLITFTFFCFVVIPEITLVILLKLHVKMADTYQRIFYTFTCVNYVSDPLIYIFGYPALRKAVKLHRIRLSTDETESTRESCHL